MKFFADVGDRRREIELEEIGPDRYRMTVDGRAYEVDHAEVVRGECSLIVRGRSYHLALERRDGSDYSVSDGRNPLDVTVLDEREALEAEILGRKSGGTGHAAVESVMPGVVLEVRVSEGDEVAQGDACVIVEAMKMENEVRAPVAGTVRAVKVEQGQTVAAGEVLVEIGE